MPEASNTTSSTNTLITVGTPQAGSINSATDQDWYRVSLTAGLTYTIRLMGQGTGSNTLFDPLIEGIYTSGNTYAGGYNNDGLISGPNSRDAMVTFRAPSTTTYWIAAAGDMGSTGSYTLLVVNSSGATDNVPASTATTATVNVGASVTGTIDTAGDVDWYRVTLNAGSVYKVTMRGIPSSGGTLADPIIAGIYDSSGRYISNTYIDDVDTRDASLAFTAGYSGDYYIAARAFSTYTGTFTLNVALQAGEVAASTATTGTLNVGGSATVTIDQPYDRDWYKVTLNAGTTYQFTLTGTGSNNMPGIWGIYDAAGRYVDGYAVALNEGASTSARTIFTPATSGTYYVDAYSVYEGVYTLSLAATTADIPANTSSTATVTVGGSVTGDIGSSTDVDWYRVSLVGGNTYTILMQGKRNNNGTLEDPLISGIYTSAGVLIPGTNADDRDGSDAAVTFRPATTGTYYIAAEGYGNYIGTFKLSVTQLSNDVGQTTATAGSVTLGTNTAGMIDDASDVDWYGLSMNAGTSYYVRMQGAPSGGGSLSDPLIAGIYNAAGTLIPKTLVDDIRGSRDAALIYTPGASTMHYVALEGYDGAIGTFTLNITADAGVTNATAWIVPDNLSATGTIDNSSDLDWYRFGLDGDTSYLFKMYGSDSGNGTLTAPNIARVLNASGAVQTIVSSTSGATSVARYATGATGDYYVELRGNSNSTGTFRVTLETEPGVTTGSAGSLTVGIPATGTIDDTTDNDWYAVSLMANTSYAFKMLGSRAGNGTLADPFIVEIRDATVQVQAGVDNTTGFGNDSIVRYITGATGTGTYYVVTRGASSSTGTFLLSATAEPGNTNASAWVMEMNTATTHEIDDQTDTDWYAVALDANRSYVFRMLGADSSNGTLANPFISSIRNGTGQVQAGVDNTTGYGNDSVVRYLPTTGATYYVVTQGSGTSTGTYRFSADLEPGNGNLSSWAMTINSSTVQAIDDSTDTDWYSFALEANRSYVFRMQGVDSGNGTLTNPFISSIRNASAQVLAGVDDTAGHGRDSVVRYLPTTAATYYAVTQGSGSTIGSYLFTVEQEAGNTTASSIAVTADTSINAAIDDSTDTDWYSVAVTNGVTYVFRMEGLDSSNGSLADPFINGIRNSTGTLLSAAVSTTDNVVGRDSIIRYTAGATTPVYVYAQSNASGVGTYRLSVEIDSVGNTTTTAASVTVGGSVTGRIEDPTDNDWYAVTLTGGTAYQIDLQGVDSENGTLADPLIASVRNSAGAVISGTTADNIVLRDAQLTFTPGANGTYYIVAASAGNTMGTFKLSVALANPAPQGFAPQSFQKADGTDVAADGFATLTGVNPAYAEPLM